jgi:hypothetical protein
MYRIQIQNFRLRRFEPLTFWIVACLSAPTPTFVNLWMAKLLYVKHGTVICMMILHLSCLFFFRQIIKVSHVVPTHLSHF